MESRPDKECCGNLKQSFLEIHELNVGMVPSAQMKVAIMNLNSINQSHKIIGL